MPNAFRTWCPNCHYEITFRSISTWFQKLNMICPQCSHIWTEENFRGYQDQTDDASFFERGKKLFDDIIIPD